MVNTMSQEIFSNPETLPADEELQPARETLADLAALAFWQRLVSVVLFIVAGLLLVALVFPLFVGNEAIGDSLVGLACIGLPGTVLYVLPAVMLVRGAKASADLAAGRGSYALLPFLDSQRSFWKTLGILCAVMFVLWLGMMVIAVVGLTFSMSRM